MPRGAEGDEGLDAFVVDGEAAAAGVARGLELEFFVGVEAVLVERGAEGLRELAAGGERGGVDPKASADPAADIGWLEHLLAHLAKRLEGGALERNDVEAEILDEP
jgi:hypothetical protein